MAIKHPSHCIVGQMEDSRYLFKGKPGIYIIFDRIGAVLFLVFILGILGTPEIVVGSESIIDFALWVKFKMAAIISR